MDWKIILFDYKAEKCCNIAKRRQCIVYKMEIEICSFVSTGESMNIRVGKSEEGKKCI